MNIALPEDDELEPSALELGAAARALESDTGLTRNARSKLSDQPAPVKTPSRVKIVLEEDPAIPPTGLYISANGRPYLLMAGAEAQVPPEVISVLNDAVMSMPMIDPQTQRVTGYRSRLRFPYRRID